MQDLDKIASDKNRYIRGKLVGLEDEINPLNRQEQDGYWFDHKNAPSVCFVCIGVEVKFVISQKNMFITLKTIYLALFYKKIFKT